MQAEDLILVSVDDHVVEPPDMFEGRVPAKWKDRAPRVIHNDDGTDVWSFEGNEIPNVGLNAVVGRPPEEYGIEPTSFEEMRPGCYDIHERIRDMNVNGVLGSMCFPSFIQFCGQLFARTEDKELALAMLQAYNDWHIETWCGAYPGRFIPLSIPPIWDPELMAAEVRRVAAKGCHAVTFSENPSKLGWPSFHTDHWDPFWTGVRGRGDGGVPAHRLVVAARHHRARRPLRRAHHPAADEHRPVRGRPALLARCCASSPTCASPCPRAASAGSRTSSSGSTTSTSTTTRLDGPGLRRHAPQPGVQRAHHHLLHRRRLRGGEPALPELDNMCWECDYPHSDSTWPNAPEMAMKYLAGVPDAEVNKITHENAMRLFRYDPFAHRPREQCTVGGPAGRGHRRRHLASWPATRAHERKTGLRRRPGPSDRRGTAAGRRD